MRAKIIKNVLILLACGGIIALKLLSIYIRLKIKFSLKRFIWVRKFKSSLARGEIPDEVIRELTPMYSSKLTEVFRVLSLREILKYAKSLK